MAEQDSPSTALAERAPQHPAVASGPKVPGMMSPDEIQAAFRVADALAQSGLYKDVHTAQQAFAKLVVGRSLGLNEAQSLSLYAMEGKIEVPATMMAGWVRQRPGYDYDVEWREQHIAEGAAGVWVEEMSGDHAIDACRVTITIAEVPRGRAVFSLADAETAGLVKDKSGWKKFPRNMLFARALSNAVRWYVPEVLGGLSIYSEGEIERVPNLAEGEGNGDEPGWGDVPIAVVHEIEKMIRRAERLGHAGLASRPAAQMLLVGQSHEVIKAWIDQAKHELDALQTKQPVERGEKPPEPEPTAEDVEHGQGAALEPENDALREHLTPEAADKAEQMIGARTFGAEPDTSALPHQTQLELAEAKLAGALNEREEREALVELRRLREDGDHA